MAGELLIDVSVAGLNVYTLLTLGNQRYNTLSTSFETHVDGNWTDYDIVMTELGGSGSYAGDMPAVAAGVYGIAVRQRIGGSPAMGDPHLGAENAEWNGTTIIIPEDAGGVAQILALL